MVRKAGGELSTKDLGVVGDHREARVGVVQLPALLEDEDEGRLMSWFSIQEGNACHGHSITSVRPERLGPGSLSPIKLLLQYTKPWFTSPAEGDHHTLLLLGQVMPAPGALSLCPKPAASSASLEYKDPPGMKSRAHIDLISKLLIKFTAQ